MRKIFLLFLATASMTGACSFFSEHRATAKLATQYATIKIIDGDRAKAQRVRKIAKEAKKYANTKPQLTVDRLIDEVKAQINWGYLDAADTLLVNALIDELSLRLTERLGSEPLPKDLRLAVDTVVDWVISAANLT